MAFNRACFENGWDFIKAGEEYRKLNKDFVPESDQILMTSLFKQATQGDMEIKCKYGTMCKLNRKIVKTIQEY